MTTKSFMMTVKTGGNAQLSDDKNQRTLRQACANGTLPGTVTAIPVHAVDVWSTYRGIRRLRAIRTGEWFGAERVRRFTRAWGAGRCFVERRKGAR